MMIVIFSLDIFIAFFKVDELTTDNSGFTLIYLRRIVSSTINLDKFIEVKIYRGIKILL